MPRFYGFIILNPNLKFECTTSMQNSERQISKIREKMITQKYHNHKNYITTSPKCYNLKDSQLTKIHNLHNKLPQQAKNQESGERKPRGARTEERKKDKNLNITRRRRE